MVHFICTSSEHYPNLTYYYKPGQTKCSLFLKIKFFIYKITADELNPEFSSIPKMAIIATQQHLYNSTLHQSWPCRFPAKKLPINIIPLARYMRVAIQIPFSNAYMIDLYTYFLYSGVWGRVSQHFRRLQRKSHRKKLNFDDFRTFLYTYHAFN